MSLRDVVVGAIAFADSFTKSNGFQATVSYYKAIVTAGSGDVSLAPPVQVQALIEMKQHQVRAADGQFVTSRAELTFLDPAIVVSSQDVIILPDGTTGPILAMNGPFDAVTGHPQLTQVYLG